MRTDVDVVAGGDTEPEQAGPDGVYLTPGMTLIDTRRPNPTLWEHGLSVEAMRAGSFLGRPWPLPMRHGRCYLLHMKQAGVRELRQQASELLRRVQKGETIEITDRGRPVALLSPLPTGGPLATLRAEGEIEAATTALAELPPPRKRRQGEPVLSESLARLRDDER